MIVIKRFADRMDGGRIYEVGDEYPRPGLEATPERIAELAGSDNRARRPLIRADAPKPTTRKRGERNGRNVG